MPSKLRPVAKLTETAHRNHEELFPNYISVLKQSDPEMIEIFDNFCFDEVQSLSKLEVRAHLQGNLHIGNDRGILIDVITQLLPWVGYPKALNALAALDELSEVFKPHPKRS